MSIDSNDFVETALDGIKEQIGELPEQMNEVLKAYHDNSPSTESIDTLEKLLSTASDSVEILQNYNGRYDRIARRCWGDHPGCYEVQCRLCEVQRLCSEETARQRLDEEDLPDCFRKNPLQSQPRCWDCSLFRLCLEEARKAANVKLKAKPE